MSAPADRMSALAEGFPSLQGRPGVRPFDVELLEAQLQAAWPGSGARHAIRFVLSVWNPNGARVDANDVRWALGADEERDGWQAAPLRVDGRSARGFYLDGYAFNLTEAWAAWDDRHRAACRAWLDDPWWP